jgi:hypothetical protein
MTSQALWFRISQGSVRKRAKQEHSSEGFKMSTFMNLFDFPAAIPHSSVASKDEEKH